MKEKHGCPDHPDAETGYEIIKGWVCLKCGKPVQLLEFTEQNE